MLTLPNCHVLIQDEIFPEIEGGALVVVVGESPTATVKLSTPDSDARKYRTVDRLTKASFTRKGDTWTFTGVSNHLRDEIGAKDSVIKIQVTPEPGCEACRK